ncbi:MAG: hypothetical protein RLZZ136_1462 [Pseudomonadota bacterium]
MPMDNLAQMAWSGSHWGLEAARCMGHLWRMQSENPLLADIVKLMNSAAGTVAGVGREARDAARERIKEAVGGFDFVSREEFDAVKDMAAKAREEVEDLKARLAALEAKAK